MGILESNVTGTLNMLEVCRQLDAKFILASTSSIYGEIRLTQHLKQLPSSEPMQPYAASKRRGIGAPYHHL